MDEHKLQKSTSRLFVNPLDALAIYRRIKDLRAYFTQVVFWNLQHDLRNTVGRRLLDSLFDAVPLVSTLQTERDTETKLAALPGLRAYAREELGLALHPHKFYFQPTRHGWSFVGGKMKPGVMMVSDRTLRNFRAAVRRRASLERYVDSVNSYLGLLQGFAAYEKKLEQLPEILSRLRGRACLTEHMNSIHIYKRFTRREAFRRQVRQARRDFQTYQFATV